MPFVNISITCDMGAGMITVHGRTARTPSSIPVNLEGIRTVREALDIPVLANGDIFSPGDIVHTCQETGVRHCIAQTRAVYGHAVSD